MSDPDRTPSVRVDVETVRVRRAPKYGVFLIAGAVLGLIVAAILTTAFQGTAQPSPTTGTVYTPLQVFGFVALICVPIGLALGGAVAVILDLTVGRRTRDLRAGHQSVHGAD
ncbi:potassium transporter Trk [Microbacterium sp. 10M-3C3]|uniref:potassium transporter Trk n=1 Tax=Microbacterium sp. 10M-3C3 TaxID=2483401 RepID=UPI000F644344|nr:potassium transporter Trk [Microbacterium sp. 10M-3C3]